MDARVSASLKEIRRLQRYLLQEKQLSPDTVEMRVSARGPTKISARYSYRRATIGSTFAARREGM